MIFAETNRLFLRALTQSELPRLVKLIGVWDVTRWLSVVPFPYTLEHAEEFFKDVAASYAKNVPEFFVIAKKTDNLLIGGIGLHHPRGANALKGEVEIGYWLAQDCWGMGVMREAACVIRDIGFARQETTALGATTAPSNLASQNVLKQLGLSDLGTVARDYSALRGENTVVRWRLTREDYEKEKNG